MLRAQRRRERIEVLQRRRRRRGGHRSPSRSRHSDRPAHPRPLPPVQAPSERPRRPARRRPRSGRRLARRRQTSSGIAPATLRAASPARAHARRGGLAASITATSHQIAPRLLTSPASTVDRREEDRRDRRRQPLLRRPGRPRAADVAREPGELGKPATASTAAATDISTPAAPARAPPRPCHPGPGLPRPPTGRGRSTREAIRASTPRSSRPLWPAFAAIPAPWRRRRHRFPYPVQDEVQAVARARSSSIGRCGR